ncbi:transposase [Escherichia coli]|nr:transposase [Escherichia coli]
MQTLESCTTPVSAIFPLMTAYFGEICLQYESSVRGDDVAISPALKCPNRNTDTPTSLTFPGAVDNGLVDKRNNFTPLQERGQSSSLLSQRALNFSLNISRAAASARALSLRLSSFSSSRNLFFCVTQCPVCSNIFHQYPDLFDNRVLWQLLQRKARCTAHGRIGTCQLNGIVPEAYLLHILSLLPE